MENISLNFQYLQSSIFSSNYIFPVITKPATYMG